MTLGDGVLVADTGATLTGTTEVADGELRVLQPVTVAALKQTGGLITAGTLTVTGAFDLDRRRPGRPGRDGARRGRDGPDQRQRRASTRTVSCATPAR